MRKFVSNLLVELDDPFRWNIPYPQKYIGLLVQKHYTHTVCFEYIRESWYLFIRSTECSEEKEQVLLTEKEQYHISKACNRLFSKFEKQKQEELIFRIDAILAVV